MWARRESEKKRLSEIVESGKYGWNKIGRHHNIIYNEKKRERET